MALRRLAQTNNAATMTGSPRHTPRSPSDSSATSHVPPPVTPVRPRTSYVNSPSSTPSISSSTPFDWDAARNRKPPPYASPLQGRRARSARQSQGGAGSTSATPRKPFIRKKSLVEKVKAIPSRIAFEIALFPHNVPLPPPKTTAWLIGGTMHLVHLCVRVAQIRKIPDSDLGWEDMYQEGEGESWFDWTVPTFFLLVAISVLNVVYLSTRIKIYRLFRRPDLVSSPHARFVPTEVGIDAFEKPSMLSRLGNLWSVSWRFLLNMSKPLENHLRTRKVQQIEVWTPGEMEMELFCLYSPVHALLWTATNSANWMIMFVIMLLTGLQLRALGRAFEVLLKDKEIIAAEVMHEYNEGFVYPRVNPIRKDVAVMTHQSEVVNVWED